MAISPLQAIELIMKSFESNGSVYTQEFSADMTQEFAIDTPVDTGRATAGWTANVNSVQDSDDSLRDKSSMANPTRGRAMRNLRGVAIHQTVFINNNTSDLKEDGTREGYIVGLENGKSSQAPTGMFRKNVARAQRILDKTGRRLRI